MSQSQSEKITTTKSSPDGKAISEFAVRVSGHPKWRIIAAQSQSEAEQVARKDGYHVYPNIIVKIQVSLESGTIVDGKLLPDTVDPKTMLIYGKNRIILYQGSAIGDVLFKMDNKVKAYFYASIVGKELEIHEIAPEQEW